jgi:hypothetical protein
LPARQRCRYIKQWVAVKHRWRLSVDTAERNAVLRVKNNLGCSGTVKVKRANIVLRRGPIVATDCGLGLARRPQAIKLDCAEWARISGLRWSSWMPQFAAGKGWYSEGCGSPCGGEPLDPVKVAVRLSRPERYQCGDLEPEPAYSLLEHRPWNEPNADWTGVDVTAVC